MAVRWTGIASQGLTGFASPVSVLVQVSLRIGGCTQRLALVCEMVLAPGLRR